MLRHRLQNATIVDEEAAAAGGVVTVGSASVELEREDGTRQEFEITSVGGVSPDSPVGRALLGKAPGEEIEVEAPRGRWRARVVSVGRGLVDSWTLVSAVPVTAVGRARGVLRLATARLHPLPPLAGTDAGGVRLRQPAR